MGSWEQLVYQFVARKKQVSLTIIAIIDYLFSSFGEPGYAPPVENFCVRHCQKLDYLGLTCFQKHRPKVSNEVCNSDELIRLREEMLYYTDAIKTQQL